jgi:general secretion pathway protein E
MSRTQAANTSRILTLTDVVTRLIQDNIISQQEADKIFNRPKSGQHVSRHPIEVIADSEVRNLEQLPLTLDWLTDWLAKWAGQPIYHIDPLKIDAKRISEVMSFAFAQRHQILAVELHANEVVIASAQPFSNQWEEDLKHVLKKEIRRVIANPDDLKRLTVES